MRINPPRKLLRDEQEESAYRAPCDFKSPLCSNQSGKIAVIHQGALGDFLLTLPILEGLHHSCPMIRIDLWTRPEHAALLAQKPFIGKERPPDDAELVPFYHDELWKEARIPPFLDGSLAILVFGQAGSRVLAGRLASRTPCPVQWIQSFPTPGSMLHVHHFLLDQFRQSGWPIEECGAELQPSPQEVFIIREYLRMKSRVSSTKPIVMHPGSGGLRKIWPLQNWWGLLGVLFGRYHHPVYLTLGPADERIRTFAGSAETLGAVIIEGFTLSRLAALLSECRLYIGSDSGVSHLASLLGIPTIVVFGPTDPAIWAPRGPKVHILKESWDESEVLKWAPDIGEIPLNSALSELLKDLIAEGS